MKLLYYHGWGTLLIKIVAHQSILVILSSYYVVQTWNFHKRVTFPILLIKGIFDPITGNEKRSHLINICILLLKYIEFYYSIYLFPWSCADNQLIANHWATDQMVLGGWLLICQSANYQQLLVLCWSSQLPIIAHWLWPVSCESWNNIVSLWWPQLSMV